MKELVVISGKGGTGKTSLTAAFAGLAKGRVLCDADVDAADLHLLMAPRIRKRTDFFGGAMAVIRTGRCTQCGLCRELCRFDAISASFVVDEIGCEGCGVCVDFCPEQAIDFPVKKCGQWFLSDTRFGPMVHARLGIAEENSGKLVSLVRRQARKLAETTASQLVLTDGPPGVGCPVIASIGGASALLIITEPTTSGAHDMARVAQLAQHFKVPAMVCVNKYDLNMAQTEAMEDFAREKGLTVLARIPFDPVFTRAMIHGKTLPEYDPASEACRQINVIWGQLMQSPAMRDGP